jgi:cellulose biosynthesis protein BcsQ
LPSKCIAFHSYKGGAGKTTIAANIAALLATNGFKVCLLDLDVYAPSLHTYFGLEPKKWINDYLAGDLEIASDMLVEITPALQKFYSKERCNNNAVGKGQLWVGCANPYKESIYNMEKVYKDSASKRDFLMRFIRLRAELIALLKAEESSIRGNDVVIGRKSAFGTQLSHDTGLKIISSIPCFCDIQ